MNTGALLALITLGATLSAIIAVGKGRSPLGWFVIGGLFPLIGVVATLCLPAVFVPVADVSSEPPAA